MSNYWLTATKKVYQANAISATATALLQLQLQRPKHCTTLHYTGSLALLPSCMGMDSETASQRILCQCMRTAAAQVTSWLSVLSRVETYRYTGIPYTCRMGCWAIEPGNQLAKKSRIWILKTWRGNIMIEGSLETKVPTIWTDEKQHSQEEAEPGSTSDV